MLSNQLKYETLIYFDRKLDYHLWFTSYVSTVDLPFAQVALHSAWIHSTTTILLHHHHHALSCFVHNLLYILSRNSLVSLNAIFWLSLAMVPNYFLIFSVQICCAYGLPAGSFYVAPFVSSMWWKYSYRRTSCKSTVHKNFCGNSGFDKEGCGRV